MKSVRLCHNRGLLSQAHAKHVHVHACEYTCTVCPIPGHVNDWNGILGVGLVVLYLWYELGEDVEQDEDGGQDADGDTRAIVEGDVPVCMCVCVCVCTCVCVNFQCTCTPRSTYASLHSGVKYTCACMTTLNSVESHIHLVSVQFLEKRSAFVYVCVCAYSERDSG